MLLMANKIAVESGLDCNQILKSSMTSLGGKGGGKTDMAQGSTSGQTTTDEIFETVKPPPRRAKSGQEVKYKRVN
ncbi:MAG: hypothetical protein IPG24_09735 [Leptospiraceae bacterium]|nr:hypothetical protein [Leptospiraceae bacterium]